MRFLPVIFLAACLCSCGDPAPAGQQPAAQPADSSAMQSGTPYEQMIASVPALQLPLFMCEDSLPQKNARILDERMCRLLLPAEFNFASYRKVACNAQSTIGTMHALWFELRSEPEYDGTPDATDILLVLYNDHGEPVDVYSVSSTDASYSNCSYVRSDSIFTVEHSESESIVIVTTNLAVTATGFVPGRSVRKEFSGSEAGSAASVTYTQGYLSAHGAW